MQYDIAAKVIVDMGKEDLLRHFLGVDPATAELIEEIPQETASLRSSDFPLLVRTHDGSEQIVLVEFQTRWTVDAVWRMIDYASRFKLKYRLPVFPAMLLFREHPTASDVYRDECFEFRYHLVKLWEQPAREVLARRLYALFPFTPAMASTDAEVLAAEQALYESDLSRPAKAELLTAMSIFAGLRDAALARRLFERRRDLMIESPVYKWIRQEGLEEGLQRAVRFALESRFGEAGAALAERVKAIDNLAALEALHRAIVGGESLETVRGMMQT